MGEREKMDDFLAEFQKHYQKMQRELEDYEALQEKYRKVQEENRNLRKKYDDLYRRSKALVQELETVMEDPETESATETAETEKSAEPAWKRQLEEADAEAEGWLDEEPEVEETGQSEAEKIRQRALAEAEAAERAAQEALRQAKRQETSKTETESEAEPKTETKAEPEAVKEPEPKKKKKNKVISIILDILFYALLVALVAGAALFARQNQAQKNDGGIFGYSYYQVLTTSMQSEIPQGSLVLVHQGTDDIQVGDDITFMVSETDVATHRCIEIVDDYNGTGMKAFNTQGVDNPHPDGHTMENNVIGKVVFHVPYLGKILALIADNLVWFVIGMVSVMVLISALRTLLEETLKERKAKKLQAQEKN